MFQATVKKTQPEQTPKITFTLPYALKAHLQQKKQREHINLSAFIVDCIQKEEGVYG